MFKNIFKIILIGTLISPLFALALSTFLPVQGGTGTSTPPSLGQMLVGNSLGGYTLTATSSLGIEAFSTTSATYFVHSSTTIPKTYTENTFTATQTFSTLISQLASSTAGMFGYIDFNLTDGAATSEGRLKWNPDDGTLDLGLPGGNVNLQIGEELLVRAKNTSGGDILKGQLVYITGSTADKPNIELADADVELSSEGTLGMATEDITNNQQGYVSMVGIVRNVNTNSYPSGTILYLSQTAGAYTDVKPTQPAHTTVIGTSLNQHATEGSIFIKIIPGEEIDELHDVLVSSPADEDLLKYNTSTGLWTNDTVGDLSLLKIGSPTYSTLQHMQNTFHSSGWISGGVMADLGGGNISVSSGSGYIRSSASAVAPVYFFDWSASSSISIPSNSIRYIGVEYNGGSPRVASRTTQNWDYYTDFPLGIAIREDGTIHLEQDVFGVGDHASKMIQREYGTMPLARDERTGGIILGETGTRNITLSAGVLWDRLTEYTITAKNTSTGSTFDRYYRDGAGGWTKEASQTQWPNTQYDNNSGTLVTMGANKYAVLWFYIESDDELIMLYGRNEYNTSAAAELESVPNTVPDRITTSGRLIGRLIYQKSASTATSIASVFTETFSSTGITSHADLSNLDYASAGHTGFAGTGVANTFTAHNIFSSLFATNASTTNATTTNLGINSETFTDLTGTGLQNISGVLTLNATGNWAGTLDGLEGTSYLENSFSTTSANYWLTQQSYEVPLTFGDGLTRTVNDIDCDIASGSVFGCLSSADWTTFNNKVSSQWTTSGSNIYYSTGNVGIGNTSPGNTLTVNSTGNSLTSGILQSGAGTGYSFIQVANTGGLAWFGVTNSAGTNGITNGLNYATVLTSGNSTALQLGTNDITRLTIDTSGNVGIGTTTPQQTLSVVGNIEIPTGNYLGFGYNPNELIYSPTAGKLALRTNTTDRLTIDSSGNVGIGDTTPSYPLDVNGVINSTSYITAPSGFYTDTGASDGVNSAGGANTLSFRTNGADNRIFISSTGNVGIGNTTAGQKLDVTGTIRQSGCTTAGTLSANASGDIICTPSSKKFKHNIATTTSAINTIMSLRPVEYIFNATMDMGTSTHLGFISEEVASVKPELATYDKNGKPYGVDTTAIVSELVRALQEEQKQIEFLKEEIIRLKNR